MEKLKVSYRRIIILDKYGIRLNRPHSTGFLKKLDRFLFKYYKDKFGLPCFLTVPKIKLQLVVNGKPLYRGGDVNCFNQKMTIKPVIVNKIELSYCLQAAYRGWFRVRNYEYNGFYGRLLEGYSKLKPKIEELELTDDPGIYKYKDYYIPDYAIEGIQILSKPKEDNKIPTLFGNPSTSKTK